VTRSAAGRAGARPEPSTPDAATRRARRRVQRRAAPRHVCKMRAARDLAKSAGSAIAPNARLRSEHREGGALGERVRSASPDRGRASFLRRGERSAPPKAMPRRARRVTIKKESRTRRQTSEAKCEARPARAAGGPAACARRRLGGWVRVSRAPARVRPGVSVRACFSRRQSIIPHSYCIFARIRADILTNQLRHERVLGCRTPQPTRKRAYARFWA